MLTFTNTLLKSKFVLVNGLWTNMNICIFIK